MNDRREGRFEVDDKLARTLIDSQFRQWSRFPLEKFISSGTDHIIYRLGDELAVRFPVSTAAGDQAAKEQIWLPRMTGFAVVIPKVIGVGHPANEFPFAWSVMNWVYGNDATTDAIVDWVKAANDLGQFVTELRNQNSFGAPMAGKHNAFRGTALINLDHIARNAIDALGDVFDQANLLHIWEQALDVHPWTAPPVWIHGDIHAANIVMRNGHIAGIIDFGLMGVGDPACDLAPAWSFLPSHARDTFRAAADVDDKTWQRGKGWGFYIGVIALSYYRNRNPILSDIAEKAIQAVIEDSESE